MYFANAAFIKDMLLSYVRDLQDVNPVEYLIVEMTPVVTVDSTAIHALEDMFRPPKERVLLEVGARSVPAPERLQALDSSRAVETRISRLCLALGRQAIGYALLLS